MVTNEPFDVIICGGGPNGLIMALGLLDRVPDLEVAICDRRALAVPDDARASALSAGVQNFLQELDVWKEVAAEASPIAHMRITDSGADDLSRPLFLSFDGDVAPGQPYAHMVPNRVLVRCLLARLEGRVHVAAPFEPVGVLQRASVAEITSSEKEVLSATLIVGADGARSFMRQQARIETIAHSYNQSAIVGTIGHTADHQQTAFEHFRPQGPLASLPLPDRRSSIVWCETPAEAARLLAAGPKVQSEALEEAMGSVLGQLEIVEPLQVFPLSMQIAREFIGPRLALIGDAAHVIHPVAGQGLNLGIKDVLALAETVATGLQLGEDIGGAMVLERYQRARRFDTALMNSATDGLTRLFSNQNVPLRILRDLGLGLVDRMPLIKKVLIRHAAGVGQSPMRRDQ